jgi:excisionase family DNA binding protein
MTETADVLTAAEAGELLGCSEALIRKRIKEGLLAATKQHRRWRIRREDVELLNVDAAAPSERMTAPSDRMATTHSADRDWDVKALELKLEGAERENVRLVSEVDHLRGLTDQQANTMQNLTEEIKGLTVALHHEQGQLRQLVADVDDKADDEGPKKPGFLRRVFTGKPKPRRTRKGKFARVGPS